MSKYYYYGCRTDDMIEIIKTGEIKSQRKLGLTYGRGFNRLDYISVCNKCSDKEYEKYKKRLKYYVDAYSMFIEDRFCFIISDEITAIKTEYLEHYSFSRYQLNKYIDEHPETRYSDMIDEYQVKDSIPLKYIIGIGIPFNALLEGYIIDDLKVIMEITKSLNLDIINTNEVNFIEEYENKKRVLDKEKVKELLK